MNVQSSNAPNLRPDAPNLRPEAPNLRPEARVMSDLPVHRVPLVKATPETVKGFGVIIDHPDAHKVEIVRWPSLGWRQVEEGTGDQGGVFEAPQGSITINAFRPVQVTAGALRARDGVFAPSGIETFKETAGEEYPFGLDSIGLFPGMVGR